MAEMTLEQFSQPFQRLAIAFNRFAFLSEGDREILTDDWYDSFKRYAPAVWIEGVDVWKRSHKLFPSQAEMHDLLQNDVAPRLVFEREERERQERIASRPPLDRAKRAELMERMRRLKASMQLKPPAASDAPPLLGDDQR